MYRLRLLLTIPLLALVGLNANAGEIVLQDIDFVSLPDDQIEIRLGFSDMPPKPTAYTIEKPARIALDLKGVANGLKKKYYTLGFGNTRSVAIMEAQGRTRLILSLDELQQFDARVDESELVVVIGNSAVERNSVAVLNKQPSDSVPVDRVRPVQNATRDLAPNLLGKTTKNALTIQPGIQPSFTSAKKVDTGDVGNVIREVDFRRGDDDSGQIIINLSDPNTPVDIRQEGEKIIVEFSSIGLPDRLHRRLDVRDFATIVNSVDTTADGDRVLVVIDTKDEGEWEYLAYQADNIFTVDVKPIPEEEKLFRDQTKKIYNGEKLSLNFQNIDVRSVLQLIADFTGLNLVASDTVSGSITLRLQNVPWDQAMDLILKTKGLDKRQDGNVLRIGPAAEIAALEQAELQSQEQRDSLAPLHTQYLRINYATADDMASMIRGSGGEGGDSLLSLRGSVTVDSRTNTLIIKDTATNLRDMRELISRLDIPVQQVLIEARIVTVSSDASDQLGINWTAGLAKTTGDGGDSTFDTDITQGLDTVTPYGGITLGYITPHFALDFEIAALKSEGNAELVATPKILTADQMPATISSGEQISVTTVTADTVAETTIDAVLSLTVTPQITPDGRVSLTLNITNDSFEGTTATGSPILAVNSINTTAMVRDGETIVLGGVFKQNKSHTNQKTPFLGDLPIIGQLFREQSNTSNRSELLIFITPKLVKEDGFDVY